MEVLAGGVLSRLVGRPILDKTGLAGPFDMHLEFAPDSSMPGFAGRGGPGEPGTPPPSADPEGPSIFTALQHLGLKLEPGKGPVEILVIDHVERPSEN
jgi:bla regulator protein blaR1